MDAMVLTLRDLRKPPEVPVIYTETENAIAHFEGVCGLGPDDPISLRAVHEVVGYGGLMCLLRLLPDGWESVLRHFACDCAADVRHHLDTSGLYVLLLTRMQADGKILPHEWAHTQRIAREAQTAIPAFVTGDDARLAAWKTAWAAVTLERDPVEHKKLRTIQCVRLFKYARYGAAYVSSHRAKD